VKRNLLPLFLGMPVFLAVLWLTASPAHAIKNFQDDFIVRYVQPCDDDPKEAAEKKAMLAQAIEKAKCNVCHNGRDKKRRNAYGDELAKLLNKKADAENTEKVVKAMEVVGKIKSDPKDENSPAYGERIRQGKLPAQPLPRTRLGRSRLPDPLVPPTLFKFPPVVFDNETEVQD